MRPERQIELLRGRRGRRTAPSAARWPASLHTSCPCIHVAQLPRLWRDPAVEGLRVKFRWRHEGRGLEVGPLSLNQVSMASMSAGPVAQVTRAGRGERPPWTMTRLGCRMRLDQFCVGEVDEQVRQWIRHNLCRNPRGA